MSNSTKDNAVDTLSNFKRQTAKLMRRMKKSGAPMILTVRGKAELIVQDAQAYARWLEFMDRAEAIVGIRQGLESMYCGEGRSLQEARRMLRD